MRGTPGKLGGSIIVAVGRAGRGGANGDASRAWDGNTRQIGVSGLHARLDVLVCGGRHAGGAREGRAARITWEADAGAGGDGGLAHGVVNGQRRGGRARAALLGHGEQGELVAGGVAGGLDGQVGVVVVARGGWLDGEDARRRVDGVPQPRGG